MTTRHVKPTRPGLIREVEQFGHRMEVKGRALLETATRKLDTATRKLEKATHRVKVAAEERLENAEAKLVGTEKKLRRLTRRTHARRPAARA